MNQTQILRQQLNNLPLFSPEVEIEALVANYLAGKEQIAQIVELQAETKRQIQRIISDTGIDRWETRSGSVLVPASGIVVSYDAHGLDGVRLQSKTVNRYILPFRSERVVSGGIRIVGY